MLYAADFLWWSLNNEWALKHPGIKVTASASVPYSSVEFLRPSGTEGYDPTPGVIRTGLNSGYQATHIAMQAGASRILLFGVDLSLKFGVHWHGAHKRGLSNPNERLFMIMRQKFRSLVAPAKELGVEILNCSPLSELEHFPRALPDDVL